MIEPYRRTGRLEGSCLCGGVKLGIDGNYVAGVGACHCSLCQKSAGVMWAAFEVSADAVSVTGEVARYNSTPFAERAFCPVCGSNLWLRDRDNDSAPYELMPALFPEAAAFPLISEIYTDCRPAYVPLRGRHTTRTRAEWEAGNRHVEGAAR
jgi:hypothetical protein